MAQTFDQPQHPQHHYFNQHRSDHLSKRHYQHPYHHHWLCFYCIWLMIGFIAAFKDDGKLHFDIPATNSFKQIDSTATNIDLADIEQQSLKNSNHLSEESAQNRLKSLIHRKDSSRLNPFIWREKSLRKTLTKSLTNKSLKQKFVEVMPILRVLSKQQRLALSALISAQLNEKKGHELKLEQVIILH